MRRPTSGSERGAALLEAVLALGIVALLAATAFDAFSRAGRATEAAARRLTALALAEDALEAASVPAFLAEALDAPQRREGAAGTLRWALDAARHPAEGEATAPLVALSVAVGPEGGAPLVALRTVRLAPAGAVR